MKYCPCCGRAAGDNDAFCMHCGANCSPETAEVSRAAPVPFDASEILRQTILSRLFTGLCVLISISLLFSFISLMVNALSSNAADLFGKSWSFGDATYDMRAAYSAASGFSFVSLIPAGLVCASFWVTFASARRYGERISKFGMTTVRVLSIVNLVLIAIVALILLAALAILFIAAVGGGMTRADFGGQNDDIVVGFLFIAFLFVIFLVVFGVFAVAQIMQYRSMGALRKTADMGVALKVSGGLAVLYIIIGAVNGLGALVLLASVNSFLSPAASLCSAAYYIMLGILFLKYNNKITAYMWTAGGINAR